MIGRFLNRIFLVVCVLLLGCERKISDPKIIRSEIQDRFGVVLSLDCVKNENGFLYKNRSVRSLMYKASIRTSCWKEIEALFDRQKNEPYHISFDAPEKQFGNRDDPSWWNPIEGKTAAYYLVVSEGRDGIFDELQIFFSKEHDGFVDIHMRGTWDSRK